MEKGLINFTKCLKSLGATHYVFWSQEQLIKGGNICGFLKDASSFLQRREGDRNSTPSKYHEGERAQPFRGNRCDWHVGSISG